MSAWSQAEILNLARNFMECRILLSGAELDLFTLLTPQALYGSGNRRQNSGRPERPHDPPRCPLSHGPSDQTGGNLSMSSLDFCSFIFRGFRVDSVLGSSHGRGLEEMGFPHGSGSKSSTAGAASAFFTKGQRYPGLYWRDACDCIPFSSPDRGRCSSLLFKGSPRCGWRHGNLYGCLSSGDP